jgi:hypothetical protein
MIFNLRPSPNFSDRLIATLFDPIVLYCALFGFAALFQPEADWHRFGYGWGDRDAFAIGFFAWMIAGLRLRWAQQERPDLWSAFLLVSGVAFGGFAAAFGFQGSYTGVAWGVFGCAACGVINSLHGVIARLKRQDDFADTPRSRRLQRVSEYWLIGIVVLGAVLFFQVKMSGQTLAQGLAVLAGVGTSATKAWDTYSKIRALGEKDTEPATLQALSTACAETQALIDINSSLQSENHFLSEEVERLREAIGRMRKRLPPDENTELPFS